MTHSINHQFVSAAAEGVDASKVRTSDWNATHALNWGFATPNAQAVAADVTLSASLNYLSAGPITINNGVTVTVSTGCNWVIV